MAGSVPLRKMASTRFISSPGAKAAPREPCTQWSGQRTWGSPARCHCSPGARPGYCEAKLPWPLGCQSCVAATRRNFSCARLATATTSSPRGTASAPPGRKSFWMSTRISARIRTLSQSRDQPPHPRGRLGEVLQRSGEGKPQVARAALAESAPVEERDALFLEQALRQLAGRDGHAADVGKGIEGAVGQVAAHAGDGLQKSDDGVAPAPELGGHGGDHFLGAAQRGDARLLDERG